jgi:hypothetical protein
MSDLDARIQQRREELAAGLRDGEEPECLDDATAETCQGELDWRMPLSGTGRSFLRCDLHWEARLAEQERIEETYHVNSAGPPDWFDEADAGERWDDDY